MKTKSILIITIIYLCQIPLHLEAQINTEFKNQLSFSLYRNENVIEPINGKRNIDKYFNGIYYQRSFKYGLQGLIGLEYNQTGVYDNCDCADNFYGRGNLKELSYLVGSRYLLLSTKSFFIHPYIQLDLYYSNSTYSGNFEGGFAAQGYNFENKYDKYGLIGRIGLEIIPVKNLFLNISCNYRTGHYTEKRTREGDTFKKSYTNWIPIELKAGVGF